ncbi:MAG: prepilin-type N-terminal cleavage/methylation domain-containing protein [Planctomycetota bacterium]|nr:prepilin-type N-terminal cleavage/methylation domain-containing protein [Planctomycetota bacterium]
MASCRTLNRESGFSLVELMLVISIAAVLFGMAVPALQNDDRAAAAARTLVSDASRARSYAKRTWENVTMQIDVANNRWRTQLQNGTYLTTAKSDNNGWASLPPGITFADIGGGNTDAVFLPTGRTASNAAFAIVQGDYEWHIQIQSLSGLISASPQ